MLPLAFPLPAADAASAVAPTDCPDNMAAVCMVRFCPTGGLSPDAADWEAPAFAAEKFVLTPFTVAAVRLVLAGAACGPVAEEVDAAVILPSAPCGCHCQNPARPATDSTTAATLPATSRFR
ncbi:hypothetical protein GCM10025857_09430 [Alicyclobacillus contaminans]|nr:hypothetical protein GCM10025857_09430 [Alicyclobacillus contaminans]